MEYGERQQRRRFVVLTAIFAGSIGILVLYLFGLQIVSGGEFSQRARDVSERKRPFPRREARSLTARETIPLFSTSTLSPWTSCRGGCPRELPGLFARLARALSCPSEDIQQKIPPKAYRQFQPIEVKGGVTLPTISSIAEHEGGFPRVSWHNKPIRSYVESGTLAHVIGYVGDITREELQVLYNKGYATGASLGKSGVEKQYDDILRGTDGKSFRVVDVKEKGISV